MGIPFVQRGWVWMTDEEATAYLADLQAHRSDVLALSRRFAAEAQDTADEVLMARWHGAGVFVRGLARLQKDLEDEALEDFDGFLADAQTMGLANEGVWLVGTMWR